MGLTKELSNGTKIVLLYTKSFNLKAHEGRTLFDYSVPIEGRVYRALKDPVSGAYYVSVDRKENPSVEGVRLSNLSYSNSEFDCNMVELNDENIIDFDIVPEDYKKINKWIEDDHKEFINRLDQKNGMEIIVSKEDMPEMDPNLEESQEDKMKELGKRIMDTLSQSTSSYEENCYDSISYIAERDPWMLETVAGLLVYISKMSAKEDSGPTIPFSREISATEELGKGANIYTAIAAIENYINNSKKIGGNSNSLNKAIYHLILESIRLKMNKR